MHLQEHFHSDMNRMNSYNTFRIKYFITIVTSAEDHHCKNCDSWNKLSIGVVSQILLRSMYWFQSKEWGACLSAWPVPKLHWHLQLHLYHHHFTHNCQAFCQEEWIHPIHSLLSETMRKVNKFMHLQEHFHSDMNCMNSYNTFRIKCFITIVTSAEDHHCK